MDITQLNGSREHIYSMNGAKPDPGVSAETVQEEHFVSAGDVLRSLWRRLWVVLLIAAICTGAAVGFDLLRTPTYEATIKILVGQKQESEVPSSLGGDVMGLQQLTQTMTQAVATRPVAEAVIDELNLDISSGEFLGNLSVAQITETQFIEVSYEDESPAKARQIADTVGTVFSEQVSEVSPSANSITATVWEEAALPGAPASPTPVRDGLIALILGGMLGIGLALLLEQLDDRWRSPEEVERVSGVPTFGIIPEFKAPKAKKGVS